jgi:hypothetical protein
MAWRALALGEELSKHFERIIAFNPHNSLGRDIH